MPKAKIIPQFENEAQERAFWEQNDSAELLDWSQAQRVSMPHLKPTSTAISIRLPVALLERIKIAANKRDIPYQSLMKVWLAEKADARH
jgi:predicted DNA binding CopG/RHH family protein